MAGYGHGSVTGIDERTLGRIDLLLFDADYSAAADAVDDSWRIAVLAAAPRARTDRERVRAHAVHAANARRDPAVGRVRDASIWHRLCLALALVLAVVAAELVLPSRTVGSAGGFGLQQEMLPAGAAAVVALSILWWLEPLRLALFLWHRAARADRSGRQSGMARLTGDLVDPRDGVAVFFALDEWWRVAGPAALAREGARVRRVRVEVLARLRLAGVITGIDEQFAALDPPPTRWRERRR
ncbi:hypothetical protein [Microbacterium lacticum]